MTKQQLLTRMDGWMDGFSRYESTTGVRDIAWGDGESE